MGKMWTKVVPRINHIKHKKELQGLSSERELWHSTVIQ